MSSLHVIAASCIDSVRQSNQAQQHDVIERIDQFDLLQEIVKQSSSQWFLLTSTISEPGQIPETQTLDAIQAKGKAVWLPKVPNSFADFVTRSLGIKMASLWFPLWDAGAIIVSADELQSTISTCDSLHEVMVKLDWNESTKVDSPEIDWADDSVNLPILAPTQKRKELKQVESLVQNFEDWLPEEYDRTSPDFVALRAGLYQWYDALEVSHGYSQDAQHCGRNRSADYWHGIMHRREPDYSNSIYWYRHVGDHPVFFDLLQHSQNISANMSHAAVWDPILFVDFCRRCQQGVEETQIAERIQAVEMVLLMQQTMQDAKN